MLVTLFLRNQGFVNVVGGRVKSMSLTECSELRYEIRNYRYNCHHEGLITQCSN